MHQKFRSCPSGEAAADLLRDTNIEQVKIGLFDTDAIFREKTLGTAKASGILRSGGRFSNVLYKWDVAEKTYSGDSFSDEAIAVDVSSGRLYPFRDKTALFIADYCGEHAGHSPRNLLKAQIARAAKLGFSARAGFEYEFSVFEETPESLRERNYAKPRYYVPGNLSYSGITPAVEDGFVAPMLATLAHAGIDIDAFHTELGPGCFEVPLKAESALLSADNAALFKTFAKIHALKHGKMATFMAKWSTEWPGQGGHLHVSLSDLQGGDPSFADPSAAPNETMLQFIAGLMAFLPEALVLCAHTTNAYRRFVPGSWAPTHSSWGVENRSCAVRAIPATGQAARLELRVPGADANPYLALSCALGCGLTGIERRLKPPAETMGDAYAGDKAAESRFPRNLLEAAERFRDSAAMQEVFGQSFVRRFSETRLWEERAVASEVTDYDRRRYFEAI
jgi:glutamine synthetase